jgi:hypothetical protein
MLDVLSPDEINSTQLLFSDDTLPPHVQLAFAETQSLPKWILDLIPQPHVSVSDLYAITLPSRISEGSVTLLPSTSNPTVFINPLAKDNILNHPIFFGGDLILAAFEKLGLEQAWLSGCKSINFNGCPDRYPLWTRTFVHAIQAYQADRSRWESVEMWLEKVALAQTAANPIETPDVIDECRDRLSVVPWRGKITGFGKGVQFTAGHLASFLSNQWLDDEMINAGSDWILRQLGASCQTR